MNGQAEIQVAPTGRVEKLILLLRGEKVLLGQQLAELYGVPVKALIQAVKCNHNRLPQDFVLQLSPEEFDNLKSQFVTSSWGGWQRALPYAFTDQAVPLANRVGEGSGMRAAKIEEVLEHPRVAVACMSANAFGSEWTQLESYPFRFRDPLNDERRFLPLRLDDAPIKGSLAQFLYINWRPERGELALGKPQTFYGI